MTEVLGKSYERIIRVCAESNPTGAIRLPSRRFHHRLVTTSGHMLKKRPIACLLFVISNAFDKVWHTGLLYKLLRANISRSIVLLIQLYLQDRQMAVVINDSKWPTAGVSQEFLLSPLIFSIYTQDILNHPQNSQSLYADDAAIFTTKRRRNRCILTILQEAVEKLQEWFSLWRFQEPDKSQRKYLGVILDQHLTCRPHITTRINEAQKTICALYPMLNHRSHLYLRLKSPYTRQPSDQSQRTSVRFISTPLRPWSRP